MPISTMTIAMPNAGAAASVYGRVGRPGTKWRGDSGKQEGDAEQQTGPHVERLMAGYAQRLYIQRKKRHHRAEGGAGEETPYRATKSYVSS